MEDIPKNLHLGSQYSNTVVAITVVTQRIASSDPTQIDLRNKI